MESKRAAAEQAVEYVQDGMIVGLGTGSTAYWAIQKLGSRVKDGLGIQAVATSVQSEQLALELGIPVLSLSDVFEIDLTIDGADEVDSDWNLIKGGGGALLREKIVAAASKELIVVVDHTKQVQRLGKFHLPVEIVSFGAGQTQRKLQKLGCIPSLRLHQNKPFITDNGNYIVDCDFKEIKCAEELESSINRIPGVVENGLFIRLASKVMVGYPNGSVQELG
ncbi:ribose-5-phosphate isomerase RpiA [Paenibacillus pinisoli]|uniref:Ribose-5-phosphate isomerase A n=1 Tax=Paenibacillus pinisoli TaxID=1276110 RepID=A0A3A6PN00_9BACL|nr:ribose-5-phosphate isomerase RpiA [Paenibacillus pinisoli]RJX41770.1 ribose-5-phosphate isomerase RpiA [Paenibacillus pinisoli]